VIEGAVLLGKFPREVAQNLSIRELIALAERKNRETAGKLRTMMQIIYHSAIAPHSKEAIKTIKELDDKLGKES